MAATMSPSGHRSSHQPSLTATGTGNADLLSPSDIVLSRVTIPTSGQMPRTLNGIHVREFIGTHHQSTRAASTPTPPLPLPLPHPTQPSPSPAAGRVSSLLSPNDNFSPPPLTQTPRELFTRPTSVSLTPLIIYDLTSPTSGSPQSVGSNSSATGGAAALTSRPTLDDAPRDPHRRPLSHLSRPRDCMVAPKSTVSNRHRPSGSFSISINHMGMPRVPTSARAFSSGPTTKSPTSASSIETNSELSSISASPITTRGSSQFRNSLFPLPPLSTRHPGSSPSPIAERLGWNMRLSRLKTPGSNSSASSFGSNLTIASDASPRPITPLSSSSAAAASMARRFGMSLNINDCNFERQESYIVREYSVVVGSYRINQNGLYSESSPQSSNYRDDDDVDASSDDDGYEDYLGEEVYDCVDGDSDSSGLVCSPAAIGAPVTPATEDQLSASNTLQAGSTHLSPKSTPLSAIADGTVGTIQRERFNPAVVTVELVQQLATTTTHTNQTENTTMTTTTTPTPTASHSLAPPPFSPSPLPCSLGVIATDLPCIDAAFAMRRESGSSRSSRSSAGGRRRRHRPSHSVNSSIASTPGSGGSVRVSRRHCMPLCKNDLIELEVIGRGQNGVVRKALHLPTLTRVAIKSMDVYDKSTRHQLLHELHAYSGLHSKWVIRLLGAYHDSGVISLASEYMDLGSLTHCMRRCGGFISDEIILRHLSFQILSGLKYLHAQQRLHRDIKPDNILINSNMECKIGDFGLMMKLERDTGESATEFMGTLAYLSPERLSSSEYSYPSDIWSVGISLIYAATGHLPIVGGSFWEFIGQMEEEPPSLEATLRKIREGKLKRPNNNEDEEGEQGSKSKDGDATPSSLFSSSSSSPSVVDGVVGSPVLVDLLSYSPPVLPGPLNFSDEFHDFLSKMLAIDPKQRWTAEELLQHKFITQARDTMNDDNQISTNRPTNATATETPSTNSPLADGASLTPDSPTSSCRSLSPLERASHVRSFWHDIPDVDAANSHDLDLILEILARRRLLKLADEESNRLKAIMSDRRQAVIGINSPGYAAQAAPITATIDEGRTSHSSPNNGKSILRVDRERGRGALLLSTSPLPNPPNTPCSVTGESAVGIVSVDGRPSHPTPSSTASPSHPSALSSKSMSSVGSNESTFATTTSGMGMEIGIHDTCLPMPMSVSSQSLHDSSMTDMLLDFSSPVPPPTSSLSSSFSGVTPSFFSVSPAADALTVAPTLTLSPDSRHNTNTPINAHPNRHQHQPSMASFVLPAATDLSRPASVESPSMPSTFIGLSSSSLVDVSSRVDVDPVTVEIVASVRRLDSFRTQVLAHQFSRTISDIQQRFTEVQLALFDQIDQEANAIQTSDSTIERQCEDVTYVTGAASAMNAAGVSVASVSNSPQPLEPPKSSFPLHRSSRSPTPTTPTVRDGGRSPHCTRSTS